MTATARPYGSCSQARTLAPGTATVTFAKGPVLGLTFDFTSQGTDVYGLYYGQSWGYARAHATFATQRTGPEVITACAAGTASQVPMDLTLTTATTLTSPAIDAPGANRGHARRLRLVVRPRRVAPGRRVTFSFQLTSTADSPVEGATIRLGSHIARSSARGTARITTTLHHPGAVVVRATKPGWQPAAVTIAVRRSIRPARTPPFTG